MAVRAGIYLRISNDPEDLEEGVSRQREDCLDRAAALGWEIVDEYKDNNRSAWNKKPRPEFLRMMEDLFSGSIEAIVIWDIDRLTRNNLEINQLLEAAVEGHRIADAENEYNLSNGDHQDIIRHKVIAANKESRDKSRRVRRAALGRAKEGLPVHTNAKKRRPFGYDFDFITICEPEARLIREAATHVLRDSESLSGVCRRWEREGIKTSRGGDRWSYQAIKSILTSPRVAGLVEWQGDVLLDRNGNRVKAQWQPILDEETWDALQRKLTDPTRRTNHVQKEGRRYLLTGGLAYCGACGERLAARPREGRNGDNRCYGCRATQRCGIRQTAAPLEVFVRDAVATALASGGLERALRQKSGDETRERKLLQEIEAVDRALAQLDDDFYDNLIPRDRWLRQKERQELHRQELTRQFSQNGNGRVLADLPTGADAIRQVWDERGLKWQRTLVSAVVEKVVVHPDKRRGQNGFDPSRVEIVWKI